MKMKYLVLILLAVSTTACVGAKVAGVGLTAAIGGVTGVSLAKNNQTVSDFGDKYLKVETTAAKKAAEAK